MVQYTVLRWAGEYPDLLDWTDNIRLLESLARHRLMAGQTAQLLSTIYQALRAAYHRNALGELSGLIADDVLKEERAMVKALWETLMVAPA